MEARLLEKLHEKLSDLDHSAQAFRHDQVVEFQRYCQNLLRDLTPTAASHVKQEIAMSFAKYPALGPELEAAGADSHPPDSPRSATFQSPPQAAVFGRVEDSTSRHDREIEFQGLFTPSYLPLLDSSPDPAKAISAAPTTTETATSTADAPAAASPATLQSSQLPTTRLDDPGTSQCLNMDDRTELGDETGDESDHSHRPSQLSVQRADDPTSSASSDRSDSKAPRSALRRRSSSASKTPTSPRRVRFEFMGAEVLPTSSPQPSEFVAPRPSSPAPEADQATSDSILGSENEEEESLPPRKISSSDALRALSRTPLDEDIVWTVVNPDMDQSSQQQKPSTSAMVETKPPEESVPPPVSAEPNLSSNRVDITRQRMLLGDVREEREEELGNSDDNSSDEEFLAMAKPKSFTNKNSIRSSTAPSPEKPKQHGQQTANAKETPNNKPLQMRTSEDDDEEDEGEDDMFHFETGDANATPKSQRKPSVQEEEEEEEESEDDSEEPTTDTEAAQLAMYATSPAVPIMKSSKGGPSTPTRTKFQPGSLGSYKGRPVVMPVVRDARVHARAASLGQVDSFVGSFKEMDNEENLSSFRASVARSGFSGAPRSLTERLILDEAMEARARREETPP